MINNWKKVQNKTSLIDLTKNSKVKDDIALEIEAFCHWVEANYEFKKELEIELVNNYYLLYEGQRVGYLFYYDEDGVPLLVLPVKGYPEKWSLEAILFSLLQGLDDYMAYQNGNLELEHYSEEALEALLEEYLKARGSK